jgi:hypothetical protein
VQKLEEIEKASFLGSRKKEGTCFSSSLPSRWYKTTLYQLVSSLTDQPGRLELVHCTGLLCDWNRLEFRVPFIFFPTALSVWVLSIFGFLIPCSRGGSPRGVPCRVALVRGCLVLKTKQDSNNIVDILLESCCVEKKCLKKGPLNLLLALCEALLKKGGFGDCSPDSWRLFSR